MSEMADLCHYLKKLAESLSTFCVEHDPVSLKIEEHELVYTPTEVVECWLEYRLFKV